MLGRAPEDKVPFPEVILPIVVEGVGSPTFLGIADMGWASTGGEAGVLAFPGGDVASSWGGGRW